jgi:predicted Zn-dependent protease
MTNRLVLRMLPALLALLAVAACVSRGDVETMSASEFSKMRSEIPLTKDAKQRDYVNCVVRDIVAELPEPYKSMQWDVEVFDNDAANAFAMAGGKIGVFTGIFKVATTPSEFAAVIGHEIAHVTEEHTVDRINRAQITGGAIAVTSILVGDQIGLGAQGTQSVLEGAAQLGMLLPFGRSQEKEADLVGLDYMAAAGFDPRASLQLWKNMAKASNGAPPEFLSTHPSSDTRINELKQQMPTAWVFYEAAIAAGRSPTCRP